MDYLLSDGLTGTRFKYSMFNPHAAGQTVRSLRMVKSLVPDNAPVNGGVGPAAAGSVVGVAKFLSN